MTYQVGDNEHIIAYYEFQDTVALADPDVHCGARTHILETADGSPAPDFITFDELTRVIKVSTYNP